VGTERRPRTLTLLTDFTLPHPLAPAPHGGRSRRGAYRLALFVYNRSHRSASLAGRFDTEDDRPPSGCAPRGPPARARSAAPCNPRDLPPARTGFQQEPLGGGRSRGYHPLALHPPAFAPGSRPHRRKPLPSPKGEAWGLPAPCDPRLSPPAIASFGYRPAQARAGGSSQAPPRPASPAFAPEITPMLAETPSRPPKGEAEGLPAPCDPYAGPSRPRRFRPPLLRSACLGRQTRKAVHPQQPAGVRSPH